MPDNVSALQSACWCPSRKVDRCERRETRAFEETDEAPRNCAALSLKVMRVTCLPTRPNWRDACYQNLHALS